MTSRNLTRATTQILRTRISSSLATSSSMPSKKQWYSTDIAASEENLVTEEGAHIVLSSPSSPVPAMVAPQFDDALSSLRAALPVSTSSSPKVDDPEPIRYQIPPATDPLLSFISTLLLKGSRRKGGQLAHSRGVVSRLLHHLHALTRVPPVPVLRAAIMAAAPQVSTRSLKRGTKVLHQPVPLSERQRVRRAVKAIMSASDRREGYTLEERFARECVGVVEARNVAINGGGKDGRSEVLIAKERDARFAMVNRGLLAPVLMRQGQ